MPPPGPDAVPPPVYRGIDGMPMFLTVPTTDLQASVDFWIEGLGFIDLFSVPGGLTHLRPGSTTGPRHQPWNSVEVEVLTPENTRVVLTAATPFDPASQEAGFLGDIGIEAPESR